jgi:hypothetical protein
MSRAFQYYRSVRERRLLNRNISVPLHILTTVYACLLAADVFACSTCLDSGTIEQRETCKVCKFAKEEFPILGIRLEHVLFAKGPKWWGSIEDGAPIVWEPGRDTKPPRIAGEQGQGYGVSSVPHAKGCP